MLPDMAADKLLCDAECHLASQHVLRLTKTFLWEGFCFFVVDKKITQVRVNYWREKPC